MSTFVSHLDEKPLKKYLDSVFISIKECRDFTQLTERELDTIIRIEEVYKIIDSRIYSVDPNLLSKLTLDKLEEHTNNVDKYLSSFIKGYNSDEEKQKTEAINRINELLEELIIQIADIYQPLIPSEVESLKGSIISARHSLAQHTRYIKEDYEDFYNSKQEMENRISELSNKLNDVDEETKKTVENIEDQMLAVQQKVTEEQKRLTKKQSDFWQEVETDIENNLDNSKRKVDEFEQAITDKQKEQEDEYNSFQKEIKQEIARISDDAEDKLKDFRESFSEKQQERTKEFSSFQEKRAVKFAEQLDTMEKEFLEKTTAVEKNFEKHKAKLNSRIEEHDEEIQIAKKDLYKLIEVAGNDVMSDGYAKYANKAAKSKLIWQITSFIVLVGLVFVAYSIIPSFEQETFNWAILGFRSLLTASVGALAGFSIRQAHLSHLDEKHNREMQLKLGSIEPYLKNFSKEKRNEIKEMLVADYFSKDGNIYNKQTETDILPTTEDDEDIA